jgi:hypothetical protein
MKITRSTIGILLAGVFALAGCGKSQTQQQGAPSVEMRGVKVDLPKLRQLMPPEKQPAIGELMSSLRYGLFPEALTQLQKLSADPSLTEEQKKVINDVTDQVKQMQAKTSAK